MTSPTSSNSSLRSLARTSLVSTPSASSRSSVSRSIAPRGTASLRPLRPGLTAAPRGARRRARCAAAPRSAPSPRRAGRGRSGRAGRRSGRRRPAGRPARRRRPRRPRRCSSASERARPRSKITRSATSGGSSATTARRPSAASPAASSTSAPPRRCGTRSSASVASGPRRRPSTSRSRPTKSRVWSSCRIRRRGVAGDAVRVEQRRVERGVAEPDPVALEARGVERAAEHGERLGGAGVLGHADELDPRLEHLAVLAARRADGAVGVGDVAEAQRQLGGRVAGGDHARDRDRHVRAQHEHVALLVEQLVRGVGGRRVPARQHLLVLERRRLDLAVAVRVEDPPHPLDDRVDLPQLVGQDVARPAGGRVDRRHAREPRWTDHPWMTRRRGRRPGSFGRASSGRRPSEIGQTASGGDPRWRGAAGIGSSRLPG